MSTTIDQRVVEMQFDNSNFERNVSTTMSTLNKLKQSLNLTGATKGLEGVDSAAKKVNLSGLGTAVETVQAKFSALQVMGVTALANITNSAVNAGKRIASALTIDPIKTGFSEYETQINAVQTILANTSSKGTTLTDVNGALDELNKYADKTIYNFTEMTRNIGTFTAAGIDLDKSVSSIQGIANLAAVSGSTSQQASTAMYQLSQALASGTVKLMDWNSVVNAGMGGQVFQDALKRTAKVMGTDVDAIIEKAGSFRESLSEGWLTADVLTETLNQFTMAAEEGSKEWENYKKSLMDDGYTEKQATEILKMANTATDAATKVKTFTQLWDTLKEAAQSGWTQTWEILVGDFEEAKSMLTNISNVLNDIIGRSAEARNKLLQGWKDAGGRDDLLKGFSNIFTGLVNVVTPIREAFREIFPPTTVKQLTSISTAFKNLTARFAEFTSSHGDQIKSTFKGIFSVIDIGWTIVKKLASGIVELLGHFTGLSGGILDTTASIGDWLSNLRDSIKEGDIFGKAIDKIVGFLSKGIDKIKDFGSAIKDGFKSPENDGLLGFLENAWNFITKIASGIGKALAGIGQGIANAFGENTFADVLDSGVFALLGVGLYKLINNLNSPFKALTKALDGLTGKDGVLDNVVGILDDVRGCFQAYQQQLKAGTLVKIASAIGILAASIFVISTIDPETLGQSLGAITVLFGELLGSLAIFTKIGGNLKGTLKAIPLMISLSTSLLILSGALKVLSTISLGQMGVALLGLTVSMAALVGAVNLLPDKNVTKAAKAIKKLSTSLLVLSVALKIMGSMSWNELAIGLTATVVGLGALVGAVHLLPKDMGLRTLGMVGLATSLVILGGALKLMGSMSWGEIGKGLATLAGSMISIAVAMRLMPKNILITSTGLLVVAGALVVLSGVMKLMGSMSWDEIGRGLTVLGGALVELSIGLALMRGSLAGSAALLVAAAALAVLAPVLLTLGSMSWDSIAKGLVTLGGAIAIFGIAGAVLSPLIPALLGIAGAFALFGVATIGIGAGLLLIGAGISALATSLAVGATSIVASITVIIAGFLDLIPTIISKLGEGILALCQVIGDCAPQIAESLLKLLSESLKALATYIPQIADSLFDLLIGVLDVLAARLPELITAAVKVIGAFFQGVVDALGSIDSTSLLEGILAVGLLSGLMFALSSIVGLIPNAMIGVLGIGVVIAELALVLSAIGALSQIPGLSWLIEEGGNFLQKIGTAIGQFIGGIAGGIAQGFTSSLPQIGNDLSGFMTNVRPFIDGAKTIDASVMDGVKTLVGALLAITGANVIESLTSWLTGGSSLTDFGKDIAEFAPYMKQYADTINGIDASAVEASANAAKALTGLVSALPKEGGLAGLFAGESNLSTFGEQLIPFGQGLKGYADTVAGIDAQAIVNSATAAKALAEMTNTIPNSGGVVAWFTGDNSISKFAGDLVMLGTGLRDYSTAIAGVNTESIIASSSAAKALAEMTNVIPNNGGVVAWFTGENSISKFSADLVTLGTGLSGFAAATAGIVPENIIAAANAAKALAQMTNTIPNEGGMVSWFTGESSIAKFAGDLPILGAGLKGFSDSTAGIATENIIAAANAAKALAQMTSSIPNEGGVVAWFTGENSISAFANQLPKLGSGLKGFSDAITGIVPENITSATNAAKSLVQMTNSIPNEGGIKAWFTGESSIATFSEQLPKLGSGLKGFSESITGINPENIVAAANAAKALAQMTNTIPKEGGVKAWFTGESSIATFASHLPELGAGLKGFSDSVAGINPENVTAASKAAKNLAQMTNTTPKDTSKIVSFGTNLKKFGGSLKSYFESTSGITGEATSVTTKAIDSIKKAATINGDSLKSTASAIDKLVKSLKSMSTISESTVSGFSNAISTLGKVNVDNLVKAFANAAPKMTKAGDSLITSLTNGIKSKQGTLVSAANNLVNTLSKTISSKSSSFNKAGTQLMNSFANGISSGRNKANSALSSTVNSAVSSIRSKYSSFYSAGSYLVTGFAAGISANTFRAEAKARAMANAAEAAAKKALAINSPSKVFMKIGAGVPEGFAKGIDKLGSLVTGSTTTMANSAINGTKKAMNRIADAINGDIDSQPTIRPVLDLSSVTAGAGAISSLLNTNPSVGVMANVNAINSSMNHRSQNGINSDVVSAIRDLKDSLGNTGDTYNVGGVTYDDGSNIADAVKSIARYARLERRI